MAHRRFLFNEGYNPMIQRNLSKSYFGKALLALSILLLAYTADSQDVRVNNPSFEDYPRQGVPGGPEIIGWKDCGRQLFPEASPPDIHQGSTNFWSSNIATAHGKTYMSLVVRYDDSYESVSQRVQGTLKAGNCYSFSISLVQSKNYLSHTKDNSFRKSNFNNPTVLQIYGGNSYCDEAELLAESAPVTENDWKTHEFKIEPTVNYTHIILKAFFVTPVLVGYNGHICLDNASNFKMINCDTDEVLLAEATTEQDKKTTRRKKKVKKEKEKTPAPILTKQETPQKEVVTREKKEKEEEEKILIDLNRKKLKVGQLIVIDKLHFDSDKSTISEDSYSVLKEVYDFMEAYQDVFIEIGGHTNTVPSNAYCDKLSTDRAKAVADYLIDKGIEEDRITYKGYGKRRPISKNRTAYGRKVNQRVQIKILGLG